MSGSDIANVRVFQDSSDEYYLFGFLNNGSGDWAIYSPYICKDGKATYRHNDYAQKKIDELIQNSTEILLPLSDADEHLTLFQPLMALLIGMEKYNTRKDAPLVLDDDGLIRYNQKEKRKAAKPRVQSPRIQTQKLHIWI